MKIVKGSLGILVLFLAGCVSIPESITPIKEFELERYLGKWYEIARLDHSFERGLEQVTADYTLREDGGVSVLNRGYAAGKEQWKEAKGKAYFVREADEGYLKVSFFGPFYGSYIIFELDQKNYQYAFISGPNLSYLWLLARTPQVDQDLIAHFIERTTELGFDAKELILVNHQER